MLLKLNSNFLMQAGSFSLMLLTACAQTVESDAKPETNLVDDGEIVDLELQQTGQGSVEVSTDDVSSDTSRSEDSEPVDDTGPEQP